MMMLHPRDEVGGDTHKNLVVANVSASSKKGDFACMIRYSVLILAVLTLSILFLPLVLPPLPPPPLLLLFVPVLILVLLFFLAFSPSTLPNMAALAS